MFDVAVWGPGSAGLSAARDLERVGRGRGRARGAGAGRRPRRGGRRCPTVARCRPAARCSAPHVAYRELVDGARPGRRGELRRRSRRDELGADRGRLRRRRRAVDERAPSGATGAPRARVRPARRDRRPRRSVEPPRCRALDGMSLGAWLREEGALPAVLRRHELASLSLRATGPSAPRCWRSCASTPASAGESFYDLEQWEGLRVGRGLGRRRAGDGRRARRPASGSAPW